MGNKSTKFALFLAIVIVWGIFGYRLYARLKPKRTITPVSIRKNHNPPQNDKLDSFSLLLSYDDPFSVSGDRNYTKSKQVHTPQTKPIKKDSKKPLLSPIPFPQVIYKGRLKLKTGKTVALVAIGNKNVNLEQGESFNGVNLAEIYDDSIKVRFLKEEKTIIKVRL